MPIEWHYYPRSTQPPPIVAGVIQAFEVRHSLIDSSLHESQESNDVLAHLRRDLEALGFRVESGKKRSDKISVPVLFGRNGKVEKAFEADAFHEQQGFVLEVEAGRAVSNNQFLKDLFQARMMQGVTHLAVAVRSVYRNSRDFERVAAFFDTLYASRRLELPLEGVLLIGY